MKRMLGPFLLAIATFGCRAPAPERGAPLVMAAASLSQAMPVLIDSFAAQTGTRMDLALGSTGSLAAQLENGAPADLFFAADETTVQRLVDRGLIDPTSARTYATGQLVVVWRPGARGPSSLADLADGRYEAIAIANPETAPYGRAAREALLRSGVWDQVAPRIVQGENVAQTYQLAQTGNADVALVARSVVDSTTVSLGVPPSLHDPIRQAAGVATESADPRAREFLEFVLGPGGRAILERHGFGAPS